MADTRRETYESNGIETIIDNDGTLWLSEKHIEQELNHINLPESTIKHHSDHRKQKYELVTESKSNAIQFL